MNKEQKYWIWFSLLQKIGSKRKQKLLNQYHDPEKIYQLPKLKLLKIKGIGEELAECILDKKTREQADKHLEQMEKNQIKIISIKDSQYPPLLKQIYDPPISLYVKGEPAILKKKAIAMVGCRDCSLYGEKASNYFSYQLAKQGCIIVSGLAKGIDSYSHIGCLEAKGKTIAVLGNGLDTIYPKENSELAKKIVEQGGAIISEYPIGTKPAKMNFPARNRIISGLSQAIVVIEAKQKSGTLITVDFALEQGREVFVVPGNINSIHSVGTNELIKQGAQLVINEKDILENL